MLALGLALMPVSVRAESDEWKRYGTTSDREEYARDHDLPTYGSEPSTKTCYGFECNKMKEDREESDTDPMNNSFRQQGTPQGSLGSIVGGQFQPR